MSESLRLRDPLFKLIIRFSNGDVIHYVVSDPIEARMITPETRYAVISSFLCQKPSECTDITVVNMRDVTFIKTEIVTLDQLSGERRMAGLHSAIATGDDRLPKTMSQIKFV